jgi:N-dimethylarginine dimethylaminohydrolase
MSCGSTTRPVAVGRGYRTNAEGIRQFAAILGRRWT